MDAKELNKESIGTKVWVKCAFGREPGIVKDVVEVNGEKCVTIEFSIKTMGVTTFTTLGENEFDLIELRTK